MAKVSERRRRQKAEDAVNGDGDGDLVGRLMVVENVFHQQIYK